MKIKCFSWFLCPDLVKDVAGIRSLRSKNSMHACRCGVACGGRHLEHPDDLDGFICVIDVSSSLASSENSRALSV